MWILRNDSTAAYGITDNISYHCGVVAGLMVCAAVSDLRRGTDDLRLLEHVQLSSAPSPAPVGDGLNVLDGRVLAGAGLCYLWNGWLAE